MSQRKFCFLSSCLSPIFCCSKVSIERDFLFTLKKKCPCGVFILNQHKSQVWHHASLMIVLGRGGVRDKWMPEDDWASYLVQTASLRSTERPCLKILHTCVLCAYACICVCVLKIYVCMHVFLLLPP